MTKHDLFWVGSAGAARLVWAEPLGRTEQRWPLRPFSTSLSMAQPALCFVLTVVLFFSMVSAAPRPPPECAGQVCESKEHPVLKYNGTCFCESHPCPAHSCETVKGFPVLAYDYNSKGSIVRLETMLNAVVTSHDLCMFAQASWTATAE